MAEGSGARTLREGAARAPQPHDKIRAARERADLEAMAAEATDEARGLAPLLADRDVRHLLAAIHGNSPHLTRILRRHPGWLPRLLAQTPEAALADLLQRLRAMPATATQAEVMADEARFDG